MIESSEADEGQRQSLEVLAARDQRWATAFDAAGLPPVRSTPAGFPGLLRIIVSQQVSVASARAILGRLIEACPAMTVAAFQATDDERLKSAGLSRQKIRYLRGIADAVADGSLDLQALPRMGDEDAIAHLSALKGVGRWSAEIYLLFSDARTDVFPADDLALQIAAQRLLGLANRPTGKELRSHAEAWRPHRGAAARFLWHYYRHGAVA